MILLIQFVNIFVYFINMCARSRYKNHFVLWVKVKKGLKATDLGGVFLYRFWMS